MIRGRDCWGSGEFGAPRGDGTHNGVDIINAPGEIVEAKTYGVVTKLGWCYPQPDRRHLRYVQVTLDGNDFRYFYVEPVVAQGDKVVPGVSLGVALDLDPFYPMITPHYHFEIIGPDGEFVDPTTMFRGL